MDDKRHRLKTENGQALILMVLAFAVMLGFAALAIDGGMIYSDRRIAQNAADAASVAGAGIAAQMLRNVLVEDWNCGSSFTTAMVAAKDTAISSAADNDFTVTKAITPTENTVSTSCHSGGMSDSYLDVHVRLSLETKTSFAHLFYRGVVKNTVDAVARVTPRMPIGYGNSIVSLTSNCGSHYDHGIVFGGNGDTTVDGGGIHSNSCLTLNGSSGTISVNDGSVEYDQDDVYKNNGGMSISPSPTPVSDPISADPIVQYCSQAQPGGYTDGHSVMLPGFYNRTVTVNNSESLTLKSGLYCFANGVKVNGGGIFQSEVGPGSTEGGVTLVILGGNFDVAGNATVKIKAPSPECNASPDSYGLTCPLAIPGMLIYMPPGNSGVVSVAGTSDSTYVGTIYAPNGTIDVGGTSSLLSNVGAQLIGNTVLIHGDTTIHIHYDRAVSFHWPAKVNAQR